VLVFLALVIALFFAALPWREPLGWGGIAAAAAGAALLLTIVLYAIMRPLARQATLRRVPGGCTC
jgi:hypothetical protein